MNSLLGYVNPLIGTNNQKRFSEGNILPLTALPNALASFTIQTQTLSGFDERWFFNPNAKGFEGIRLTHQPSPWVGDYGQLLIMPIDETYLSSSPDTWYSSFSYKDLILKPHIMKCKLAKYQINFELVPTETGCQINVDYSTYKKHQILLKGIKGSTTFVYNEKTNAIEGKTNAIDHTIDFELNSYFVIKMDNSFDLIKIADDMYIISFDTNNVKMKLATSFISLNQAYINHNRELEKDFITLKVEAINAWESKLNRIKIVDNDYRKVEMFYTSLYRMYLFPRKFYEEDENGNPIHINLKNGVITAGKMYVDNGFWDTYRTVYPYYALMDNELYIDFLEGLNQYYVDTRKLPKWLSPNELNYMPGNLVIAVIADAIIKGFLPNWLEEKLVKIIIEFASIQDNNDKYSIYGYYPYEDKKESVNETLDHAYTDFCIYQVLNKYNHPLSEWYYQRSKNYQNLFDSNVGFMRAKDKNGQFKEPFNPISWGGDYTEGSAWQNSFAVYHDIIGLNKLYNGKLYDKIDALFSTEPLFDIGAYGIEIHEMTEMYVQPFGQCAISNQPSFHIPYIYSELGDVRKTYSKVKWIIEESFLNQKYPGDEDNGTMAGWYVFSVLGFYPLCPCKNTYTVSYPLIEQATLHIHNNTLYIDKKDLDIDRFKNHITYESLNNKSIYKFIVEKEEID